MLNRKERKQLIYLLLAIFWGLFIFYLSSIPDLKSSLPSWQDFILRKLAHIFVFFVLTYLIANSLVSCKRKYLYFVILVGIAYAFIDELHQSTVLNRYGSAKDILIDSIGVYLAIWVYKCKVGERILKKIKKQPRCS